MMCVVLPSRRLLIIGPLTRPRNSSSGAAFLASGRRMRASSHHAVSAAAAPTARNAHAGFLLAQHHERHEQPGDDRDVDEAARGGLRQGPGGAQAFFQEVLGGRVVGLVEIAEQVRRLGHLPQVEVDGAAAEHAGKPRLRCDCRPACAPGTLRSSTQSSDQTSHAITKDNVMAAPRPRLPGSRMAKRIGSSSSSSRPASSQMRPSHRNSRPGTGHSSSGVR